MSDGPRIHTRTYGFVPDSLEVRNEGVDAPGDGWTLSGMAVVYDAPTRIADFLGEYEEIIRPGAAARSLAARTPVLQFDHGNHPMVGSLPIGSPTWTETNEGVHVHAPLFRNWLVEPVRDAIAMRAITGMSFRFSVPNGGDMWTPRDGQLELREITDFDMYEGGPVVFPAYPQTTADMRGDTDVPSGPAPECAGDETPEADASPSNSNANRFHAAVRLRQLQRINR